MIWNDLAKCEIGHISMNQPKQQHQCEVDLLIKANNNIFSCPWGNSVSVVS